MPVKYFNCLLFLIMAASLPFAAPAQKTKKAVFIIVDGIAADKIDKLQPPNFMAIAQQGGFTHSYVGGVKGTYSQTPTISAVGYNSILTGTWVNKHNVLDNDIAAPNYNYPTIFRLFKEAYPQKTTAIYSSWQDNRTKLVGDNFAPTGNIKVDYAYDGLELDTVTYPHDKARSYMSVIDETIAAKAAEDLKNTAPDLTWVYLEYTDDMGHLHGDSPEYDTAIMLADKRVGYIWNAIQFRKQRYNEDWLMVITTDHGRDAVNGKGHGGQSDRERSGWIVTNAKGLNEEFKQPQAAMTDIMPSIARFLSIDIPKQQLFEVDGTPFIGKLSFAEPHIEKKNSRLNIAWKPLGGGNMKVWIAATNNAKTGGKDAYTLLGTVPVKVGKATFDISKYTAGSFAKVVLQADLNVANYWLMAGQ